MVIKTNPKHEHKLKAETGKVGSKKEGAPVLEHPDPIHMDSPDLLAKWKKLVMLQLLYDDAKDKQAANATFFAHLSKAREAIGAPSPTEAKMLARAEAAKKRWESKIEETEKRIAEKSAKAKAKAAGKAAPKSGSGYAAGSSTDKPKIQYDKLDMNSLRAMIISRGAEPKGRFKRDLITILENMDSRSSSSA